MSKKELTPQDYINYQVLTDLLEFDKDLTLAEGVVLSLSNATEISEDLQEYVVGTDYPEDHFTEELHSSPFSRKQSNSSVK